MCFRVDTFSSSHLKFMVGLRAAHLHHFFVLLFSECGELRPPKRPARARIALPMPSPRSAPRHIRRDARARPHGPSRCSGHGYDDPRALRARAPAHAATRTNPSPLRTHHFTPLARAIEHALTPPRPHPKNNSARPPPPLSFSVLAVSVATAAAGLVGTLKMPVKAVSHGRTGARRTARGVRSTRESSTRPQHPLRPFRILLPLFLLFGIELVQLRFVERAIASAHRIHLPGPRSSDIHSAPSPSTLISYLLHPPFRAPNPHPTPQATPPRAACPQR